MKSKVFNIAPLLVVFGYVGPGGCITQGSGPLKVECCGAAGNAKRVECGLWTEWDGTRPRGLERCLLGVRERYCKKLRVLGVFITKL